MALARRYNHSNPTPNPSKLKFPSRNSVSSLADSVNLLAGTISSTSAPSDSSSRDAYLESTLSILDTCNLVSAEIERLRLSSMRLKFALQLLSSYDNNSMNKAGKILSELEMMSCDKLSPLGSLDELKKVETAVKRLKKVIDGGERAERMKNAVTETNIASEELIVSLDSLTRAVNGLFSVVLSSRNGVLERYRVGHDS